MSTTICLDSFPKHFKRSILMYYTVRSTRITVLSFGICQVMLYADTKKIKIFVLPEKILCGTIINVPLKCAGSNGNGKVLICGSSEGSIFILPLPTSKDAISILKKRYRTTDTRDESSEVKDFTCAYKYSGLTINSISCFSGKMLVLGKDERLTCNLFIFQVSVLYNALKVIGCYAENVAFVSSRPYEAVVIAPPSTSTLNDVELNLLLFQGDQSQSSPFHTSLDNVQCLEKTLFMSMFDMDLGVIKSPVACFFYDSGEVWFLTLSSECRAKTKLNRLINLYDACASVSTSLLGPDFGKMIGKKFEKDSPKHGLMLFGKENGVHFLFSNSVDEVVTDNKFTLKYIPYSNGIKSFTNSCNDLVPRWQASMQTIQKTLPGVNITSDATSFLSEQQVGLKKSDRYWKLQKYEDENKLLLVDVSKLLSGHAFSPAPQLDISRLLDNLNASNTASEILESRSKDLTNCIKDLSKLATYLTDGVHSESLFTFSVSHASVICSDTSRLCITIKVSDTAATPILSAFLYDLHVTIKHASEVRGETHNFRMPGTDKPLCVMVDKEIFESTGSVKLLIFVCLKEMKMTPSELEEIFLSSFPILISIYSKDINIS